MAVTINGTTGISTTGDYDAEDGDKILLGTSDDLQIYHNGTDSVIQEAVNNRRFLIAGDEIAIRKGDLSEDLAKFNADGAVELYHNNIKTFETTTGGAIVQADDGGSAYLHLYSDKGDDNGDKWQIKIDNGDQAFMIKNYASGSWETSIECNGNGNVELYYDNTKRFHTNSVGAYVTGRLGISDYLYIENNADFYLEDNGKAHFGGGSDLQIYHDGSDSQMKNTTGALYLDNTNNAGIVMRENGSSFVQAAGSQIFYSKTHHPWATNAYSLGTSSAKWDDVWAVNGSIQTSDKNEKNTIVDTDLGLSFVNKLKPVSYKFNSGTRTHYGLIAQDIETTLSDISKPTTGFAGFIKEDIPDQVYDAIKDEGNIPEGKKAGDVKKAAYTSYGLRYDEFISPLIKAVQELSAEVDTLKTEKTKLQTDLTALTARVAALEAA